MHLPHCAPATLVLSAGFSNLDWVVVAAYVLLLIGSAAYFARREPAGASEYFLANRRMPAWAVAFSIIASTLSVATFVGVPEQTYADGGNLTYLASNIGGLLAIVIIAFVFIPAFYKANVTTVYELLDERFGGNAADGDESGKPGNGGGGAKRAASAAFMIGRVFASGARLYIGAIPIAMLLFGLDGAEQPLPLIGAILLLTVAAVVCTLIGGIASVIYTDVIQTIVLLGAVVGGVILLLSRIPAGVPEIVGALQAPHLVDAAGQSVTGLSKLTLFDFSSDLTKPFTVWAAILGFSLINLASYGTDHDMVQRMLTCKNAVQGGRSAITAILMGIPIVLLFLIVGLLLFVFYKQPALMGSSAPGYVPKSDKVLITFVLREFPSGLSGLMVAGLFAVGLGSLNSAINAMAATFIKDFYMPALPGRSERHYLLASRWAVTGWGVVLALFAVVCIYWKKASPDTPLLDFALGVMTFAYSGLLAVFLCAIFTRRGTNTSAIAALIAGFFIVVVLQPVFWLLVDRVFPGLLPPIPQSVPEAALLGKHTSASIKKVIPICGLAFPWHMLIGTTVAFAVAIVGTPARSRSIARASA